MSSGRISTSDSLNTHQVWQKSIGHDPYAGAGDEGQVNRIVEQSEINSSAKGLFRLAQLTGHSSTLAPGACKKCGQVGHLYFQFRNWVKLKDRDVQEEVVVEEEDPDSD